MELSRNCLVCGQSGSKYFTVETGKDIYIVNSRRICKLLNLPFQADVRIVLQGLQQCVVCNGCAESFKAVVTILEVSTGEFVGFSNEQRQIPDVSHFDDRGLKAEMDEDESAQEYDTEIITTGYNGNTSSDERSSTASSSDDDMNFTEETTSDLSNDPLGNCPTPATPNACLSTQAEGGNQVPRAEKTGHACTTCNYVARSRWNLRRHELTHTGERPFKCNICEYSAIQKQDLDKHHLKHTKEKPHKCGRCGFATVRKHRLDAHKCIINAHTSGKPYKCSQCTYSTNHGGCFNRHVLIHTGEKTYKCDQCDYATIDNSRLTRHRQIHNGGKSYKCPQCTFSTNHAGNLKRHNRIHTGEKPFSCDQCDFTATQRSNLNQHRETHTREKPHQ